MMQLKIDSRHFTLRQKLQLLLGILSGIVLTISDIILDKNESLIFHSYDKKESVMLKADTEGSLEIFIKQNIEKKRKKNNGTTCNT